MWARCGQYVTPLKRRGDHDKVFAYIGHEDASRPVTFQLQLLHDVGSRNVELLHQYACFAAFGAIKYRRFRKPLASYK